MSKISLTFPAFPSKATEPLLCKKEQNAQASNLDKWARVLFRPVHASATLSFRMGKFVTWVCPKASFYKLMGYHDESSSLLEREYLQTARAVRDFLSLPAFAKRFYDDLTAVSEQGVDDLVSTNAKNYLNVGLIKKIQQFSSHLHGCRTFKVFCPEQIEQLPARTDASLKAVMASHFLKPDLMAINFGCPNVSTFRTKLEQDGSTQTLQVDAKSFWREEMSYHETNGKIQSGLFFIPTNLPKEALARFDEAAKKLEKRKDATCVNTNCRVLKEAGFSIEAVNMDEVIFPTTLMEHLLFRNVFYKDLHGIKHKVHFDILNTTPHNLEDYYNLIDTAVIGTRYRHNRRNSDTEENRQARGIAAQQLIAQEKERLAKNSVPEIDDTNLGKRKVTVSVPSLIADGLAHIWGRHTIYEVDLSSRKKEILEAFQTYANNEQKPLKLSPFPEEKPSLATRIKRDFFFSAPMIQFLRRHMMGHQDVLELSMQDVFDHLKSIENKRLNYVLLDDKVVIAYIHPNAAAPEAHKKMADWTLSKHALLSGRKPVFCAGEMWYDREKKCFMLNDDSGTHKTDYARVVITAGLANTIFDAKRFGHAFEAIKHTTAE